MILLGYNSPKQMGQCYDFPFPHRCKGTVPVFNSCCRCAGGPGKHRTAHPIAPQFLGHECNHSSLTSQLKLALIRIFVGHYCAWLIFSISKFVLPVAYRHLVECAGNKCLHCSYIPINLLCSALCALYHSRIFPYQEIKEKLTA